MDIKPDNIYHLSGNKFKIGDFGRAVKLDQLLGVEEGDIRYMPLEILNNDISDLTRVDVFSLGASAYELALNSPIPSSGDSFKAIREGNLAFLPSFSPAFQELLKVPQIHHFFSFSSVCCFFLFLFASPISLFTLLEFNASQPKIKAKSGRSDGSSIALLPKVISRIVFFFFF